MIEHKKRLFLLTDVSNADSLNETPNFKGWSVVDAHNGSIGSVEDLWIYSNTQRVVYLDVKLDFKLLGEANSNDALNQKDKNHVIIPIGFVKLHDDLKIVQTIGLESGIFKRIKRYGEGDTITRNYENEVLQFYIKCKEKPPATSVEELEERLQSNHSPRDNDDFYDRHVFYDRRFKNHHTKW